MEGSNSESNGGDSKDGRVVVILTHSPHFFPSSP